MDASDVSVAKLKAAKPHLARRVAVTHFVGPPCGVFSKALDYSQLFGAEPREKSEKLAWMEQAIS